jgi:hypothetical protein
MLKHKKIAKYASMASNEAHEEWMNYTHQELAYYYKDILSEMIDKFDRIEAMANDNWVKRIIRKRKYGNRG